MNARLPEGVTLPPVHGPKWFDATIESIRYWTPRLVSFRIGRDQAFRFVPGRYARLGLPDAGGEIVWRPFSMVSGPADDYLEFIAILVEGGEFSGLLAQAKVGDRMLVERANFGFMTLDQLAPGKTLWMLASGTGIGPFLSILRDPAPWTSFRHLVLVHSVRHAEDLVFRDEILAMRDVRLAQGDRTDLRYLPVVTRQQVRRALSGRITDMSQDGRLESAAGLEMERTKSRVMVCGNPELTQDMRAILSARGFATSRRGVAGQMAFEKYW